MSIAKPMFLELFEDCFAHLQALAAQDVAPPPKNATPEALQIFAANTWEHYQRMLSTLKEVNASMSTGIETIRDLQIAKDPDVERHAFQIYAASSAQRCKTAKEAFTFAEEFRKERDARRAKEREALLSPAKASAA